MVTFSAKNRSDTFEKWDCRSRIATKGTKNDGEEMYPLLNNLNNSNNLKNPNYQNDAKNLKNSNNLNNLNNPKDVKDLDHLRESAGFRELWSTDSPLDQLSIRRRIAKFGWINESE
jgi:hypothetical protein